MGFAGYRPPEQLYSAEHFLQQIAEMVETGEVPDASTTFLPSDLQAMSQPKDHVPELSRVVGDSSFHLLPVGHQVKDETKERSQGGRGRSLGKSRRVAAVDEGMYQDKGRQLMHCNTPFLPNLHRTRGGLCVTVKEEVGG